MEDLFDETMIKLTDKDFNVKRSIIHSDFRGKFGYVMAYAPWCPHCQEQSEFWSYLGRKLNTDPLYRRQDFRIGVINSSDPKARNILQRLKVNTIPQFFHVTPSGVLEPYQGQHTPEGLLQEACHRSGRLCVSKK